MASTLDKSLIQRALTTVDLPNGEDLVTAGAVEWVTSCDGYGSVKLAAERVLGERLSGEPDESQRRALAAVAAGVARSVGRAADGAGAPFEGCRVQVVDHSGRVVFEDEGRGAKPNVTAGGGGGGDRPLPQQAAAKQAKQADAQASGRASILPGVDRVIAVGAGKGGVGKSTVSVNLAVGLARKGHSVGLLDGDIYGPSLPTMLGLDQLEQVVHQGKLQPFGVHGVKSVTIGKLVDAEKPLIWRGPMAHGAFQQLTDRTNWGELDYLIVDLPPGTGDVPLTLAQSVRLTGAVVVCTPQRVAQDDASRAVRMFQQLGVDVLGVVENMSYFVGDDGTEYDIFGRGGASMMAQRMGLSYLGAVPITMGLREASDDGDPTRNFEPGRGPVGRSEGRLAADRRLAESLESLVKNLESQATLASLRQGATAPTLSIS